MMQQCWDTMAEKRPTFEFLSDFFNEYYESTEPNYRSEKLELQLKKEGLLNNLNNARNRTPPTAAAVSAIHSSSFVPIQSSTPVPVQPLLPHPASFVQVVNPSQLSHVHSLSTPVQQPRAFVPVVPHAAAPTIPQLVNASNGSLAAPQPTASGVLPIGASFRVVPNGLPLANGQQLVYAAPAGMQFVAAPNLQQLVQQQQQSPSTNGSTSSLPNAVHLQMQQLQQLQLATTSATSMLQQAAHAAAHASPLAIHSASQLPPDALAVAAASGAPREYSAAGPESGAVRGLAGESSSHKESDAGRRARDQLAGAINMDDSFIAV